MRLTYSGFPGFDFPESNITNRKQQPAARING